MHPESPRDDASRSAGGRRYERYDLGIRGVTARHVDGSDVTRELEERVVGMYRAVSNGQGWPAEPGAIDRLEWFVRDRPGVGELLLLEDGEEVIGASTPVLDPYVLHGRRLLSTGSWHVALDPRWQGSGVYRLRTDHARAFVHPEADFAIGPMTHPATMMAVGVDLFVLPNGIELYRRPLDARLLSMPPVALHEATASSKTPDALARQAAARFRPSWLRRVVWEWRAFKASTRARRSAHPTITWTIERAEEVDEAFVEFLPAALAPFEFYRDRTREYLAWRYLDLRGGLFDVLVARQDGGILGYVALGRSTEDAPIADLLVLPSRLDVLYSLLDRAVEVARDSGHRSIVCWVTRNHPYREVLQRLGFTVAPAGSYLAYRAHGVELSELDSLGTPDLQAHLVMGDSNHA